MKKVKIKQGSLVWDAARQSRIGSSEVFDIVRYYASAQELQNCDIDAEKMREEKPYTSVWALYHKIKQDGLFHREELPPEFAVYGHVAEEYGRRILQSERSKKLNHSEVWIGDRLIASTDVSGISEDVDVRHFDYGGGEVMAGRSFVCEQKTIMPLKLKKGLPLKHIIQAQYQISVTGASFYILQIMTLKEDNIFERGYICGLPKKKRFEYLDQNMTVSHVYFNNNEHLAMLIKTCLERFFEDVDNNTTPTPFLESDSQKYIIESLRANSFFNPEKVIDFDLRGYLQAKAMETSWSAKKTEKMQEIIETAMNKNACKFASKTHTASFSKSGAFLVKELKEVQNE